MTKSDLVEILIESSNGRLDKDEADDCITTILGKIAGALIRGEVVKLHNIGSLKLYRGAARLCRDVVRGLPLAVPAKARVRFITSSILKKKLGKLSEKGRSR